MRIREIMDEHRRSPEGRSFVPSVDHNHAPAGSPSGLVRHLQTSHRGSPSLLHPFPSPHASPVIRPRTAWPGQRVPPSANVVSDPLLSLHTDLLRNHSSKLSHGMRRPLSAVQKRQFAAKPDPRTNHGVLSGANRPRTAVLQPARNTPPTRGNTPASAVTTTPGAGQTTPSQLPPGKSLHVLFPQACELSLMDEYFTVVGTKGDSGAEFLVASLGLTAIGRDEASAPARCRCNVCSLSREEPPLPIQLGYLPEPGTVLQEPMPASWQSLFTAARLGRTAEVWDGIEDGAPIDGRDSNGNTLLMVASQHGNVQLAQLLLNNSAEPNARNSRSWTALLLATLHSRGAQLVTTLLRCGADPRMASHGGVLPLHLAAYAGDVSAAQLLINACRVEYLNASTAFGHTPLHMAAHAKSPRVIELLCAANASPLSVGNGDNSVIHYASSRGDQRVVALLLRHNADALVANKQSQYPLHIAASHGHRGVLEQLVAGIRTKMANSGESVESQLQQELDRPDLNGRTPILLAAHGGHIDACTFLLKQTRSKNATDHEGRNGLHLAAMSRTLDKILGELLVKGGVQVETCDNTGMTPLLIAASLGCQEGTAVLLGLGADPNACNRDGQTTHHIAAASNYTDWMRRFSAPPPHSWRLHTRSTLIQGKIKDLHAALKLTKYRDVKLKRRLEMKMDELTVLEKGIKAALLAEKSIDYPDKQGRRALHMAALSGYSHCVALLLERHADPTAPNAEGQPPLYLATEKGNMGAVALLMPHSSSFEMLYSTQTAKKLGFLDQAGDMSRVATDVSAIIIQSVLRPVNVIRNIKTDASMILQRAFRYAQRRRVALIQRTKMHKLRREAAETIQRSYRCHRARCVARTKRHELAAFIIQPVMRGFLGRRLAKHERIRQKNELELKSARLIARVGRGHIGRRKVFRLKAEKVEEDRKLGLAAARLQGLYRGRRDRIFVTKHRYIVNRKREVAARGAELRARKALLAVQLIQRVWWGYKGRKIAFYIRQRKKMANMMDEEAVALKEAYAVQIQCSMRCALARRRVANARQALIDAEELKIRQLAAALTIQRCARGLSARSHVRRLHRCATKIQGIIRRKQAQTMTLFMAMDAVLKEHKWNALHYATHHGNINGMVAALDGTDLKGNNIDQEGQMIVPCPVDSRGGSGETAFQIACGMCNRATAELLLERGAEPNAQDGNGWTALRWTTEGVSDLEFVRWLVMEVRVKVNLGDNGGCTPIHNMALQGSYQGLGILFDALKLPQKEVLQRCDEVLTEARALNTRRKLVNELVGYLSDDLELTEAAKHAVDGLPPEERPKKSEAQKPYQKEGYTAKNLLAEAETVSERQGTLKKETAEMTDEEFMAHQWDKKVKSLMAMDEWQILMYERRQKDKLEAARREVSRLLNIEMMCRMDAKARRPGQVRDLQAVLIPYDNNGRSPLHYATYGSQNTEMLQCFSLLLQNGAKTEKQDTEGLTVHHLAVINKRPRVSQFLAPLPGMNLKDKLFRTPIYYAAVNGDVDICTTLLKHCANIRQADIAGNTPLMRASNPIDEVTKLRCRSAPHRECASLIRLYGYAMHIQRVYRGKKGRQAWIEEQLRQEEAAGWEERQQKAAAQMMQATFRAMHTRVSLSIQSAIKMDPIYQPKPGAHSDRGWNIMHFCCYTGSLAGVRLVIDTRRALKRGRLGELPIHLAMQAPHSKNAIIALLAQLPGVLNAGDGDGRTVLHAACVSGDRPLVELLIKLGANIHVSDELGTQPSHAAAQFNQPAALGALISGAADIDANDGARMTPLMHACAKGSKECVQLLLQAGAKVTSKDKDGANPLHHAIRGQSKVHLEICDMLLEQNNQLIIMTDKLGHSALHAAAEGGDIEILDRILQLNQEESIGGGIVDVPDTKGATPLHFASRGGNSDAVFLLMSQGGDANAADSKGQTPMHWACGRSMCEAVQILVEQGQGNPNKKDSNGTTPLDIAKKKKDKKTILYLEMLTC